MERGKLIVGQAWANVFPQYPGSVSGRDFEEFEDFKVVLALPGCSEDTFVSQGRRIKLTLLNSLFAFFFFFSFHSFDLW